MASYLSILEFRVNWFRYKATTMLAQGAIHTFNPLAGRNWMKLFANCTVGEIVKPAILISHYHRPAQ